MDNQDFQKDMKKIIDELKKMTDTGKNVLAWSEVINIDSEVDGEPGNYMIAFRTLELPKTVTGFEAIEELTKALAKRKSTKLIRRYMGSHEMTEWTSKKKNGGKMYLCLPRRKPGTL